MPRVPEEFLDRLRERSDIVEFISSYVDLKKAGRLQKGLCPFHNEKTPSFTVYPDNQSFYCFGCGKGGDVITFAREIENLDYMEAVKLLADRAGLSMPEDNYDDSLAKKKARMRQMNAEAARFFYQYMMSSEGSVGLNYWTRVRGLSMQTIRHFGLGYAPDDWRMLKNHMNRLGYSDQELYEANLIRRSEKNGRVNFYDNYRNRVMVPIIDLRGNIIGFGGRVLDDSKPKYINTSDTLLYHKTDAVFALNFAKNAGTSSLILCEGYMDVIALHQAGFTNAVAGLGTALTDEQVRLLARYCDQVYLCYDSDGAGRTATDRALQKFNQIGLKVRVLSYSGGKDPDEILKNYGPSRFQKILDEASGAQEYLLGEQKQKYDLSSDDGKHDYIKDAMPILASQDRVQLDISVGNLSKETGVSREAIIAMLGDYRNSRKRREERQSEREAGQFQKLAKQTSGKDRYTRAEEIILNSLLRNPDMLTVADRELNPEDFHDPLNRRFYLVLRDRIRNDQSIDPIHFSGDFTPEEMGILFKPRAGVSLSNTTEQELNDCISLLKQRRHSESRKDAADMNDEEFRNAFKRKGT